jgi:hypothetical protein
MKINLPDCNVCSFAYWLWSRCVSLNLKVHLERHRKMKIGDKGVATIAPTAQGNPATVQAVVYNVAPPDAWKVTPADDGLSAALEAVAAGGASVLTVTGVNVAGVTLSESADLPAVDAAVPAADKLNLTVTF